MNNFELVMQVERFNSIKNYFNEKQITEIKRIFDDGREFVKFEINIESAFDLLDFFHSGVMYGLKDYKNQL